MATMQSYRNEPERRLEELLETANLNDASEEDIKRRVANLIESLVEGQQARLEVGTESGSIDILFGNVIIEAKKRDDRLNVAPIWDRRDQRARRNWAASQLQDYVNDRYGGIKSASNVFVGYTTNGKLWKRWDVLVGGEVPTEVWRKDLTQASIDSLAEIGATRSDVHSDLLNDLTIHLGTRPAPPDDLSRLIADLPALAHDTAKSLVGRPEFEIKRSVWEDLMRGAFVLADDSGGRDLALFATHSILVDIARRVADNVTHTRDSHGDPDQSAFYSWLYHPETEAAGENPLTRRIAREIDRYNWRLARHDILKSIYHEFIPRDVRHDFGEYYTPDWLAEAVCEYLLDDDWCEESVKRASNPDDELLGIGVLEPSCGSGTFLRAAALRLLPFAAQVTDDRVEQANIICRLVYGLDIHPVAVELARSTLLAALPDVPSHGSASINVNISDSLRWMQDTQMRLLGGGILINVPAVADLEQLDVLIPNAVVLHRDFGRIIDEMLTYGGAPEVLTQRLAGHGIGPADTEMTVAASETLHRLRREDRNHVWGWYIKNVAEAYRLHHRKFDRIVGNPPWITRKDITRGGQDRAKRHRDESIRIGVWAGGMTHATQNNLAALFAASVTLDYTESGHDWRVGYVLPWSALRTATWRNFRLGRWGAANPDAVGEFGIDMSESPWDLRGVDERPFPQSDSCVVFGKRAEPSGASVALSDNHELWEVEGARLESPWSDLSRTVQRRTLASPKQEPSGYIELAANGATLFPVVLVRLDVSTVSEGGRGFKRFRLEHSRHGAWSEVDLGELTIESDCVRRVSYAADLAPFRLVNESLACLPPDDVILSADPMAAMARDYERFTAHWVKADRIWKEQHGPTPPITLIDQINYRDKFTAQIGAKAKFRVAYPGSGRSMFGVCLPTEVIVNHGCYYLDVADQSEADYLCAILTADSLQTAYIQSQVTDRHYDLHPLRSVPLPLYDASDSNHMELAKHGRRATEVSNSVLLTGGTSKMRAAIRDALREDGVMGEIDRCVQELLPNYTQPSP